MERNSDVLGERGPTGEEDLDGTTDIDSQSGQPQRRIQPLRSTRSGRFLNLAQALRSGGVATTEILQATRKKQKPPATSDRDPLVVTPLHTRNTSVTKARATSPSLPVPNDSHKRSLVSHGAKRQDPLEAIENVRKRARREPDPPTTTAPQTAPPITIRNTSTKNTKRPSNGAPGLFTSSMTGNGGRRPNRRQDAAEHAHQDDSIVELSDDPESPEINHQLSRNTGLNNPMNNKFLVEVKIKAEQLSSEIMSKTTLLVTATNLQDMAPVTVKLECYKGFSSFLDFLAEECVLGDLSSKVTDASATYTWNGRKHRFRRERLDVDWQAFCNGLRDAFQRNPTFAKQGCEVGMLLHVAA